MGTFHKVYHKSVPYYLYHTHLMNRIATYFAKREAKKRIMENFDIEAMKKKYSEESPEEKEKRTKMQMFPAVMNIIVGIAMVVVGAMNDDVCNGDMDATYFLKVAGSVLLVSNALKIVSSLTKCECDDKIADFITPCLDFAYFIVVIWGSVLVFGAWSTIQYDDAEKAMYCPAHAFNFAFYYLVFYWIFLPLMCCCGMMACCCKMAAKMSPPKGEGE